MSDYAAFLDRKTQLVGNHGFEPIALPDALFDFQAYLTTWALRKGRGAIFADTGLGKTAMQLAWADNVVRHTGKRVLILTPLAVGVQTVQEAEKFGITCERSRDGSLKSAHILVTNYEQLEKFSPQDFIGVVCDESGILKHFSGATQQAITRFALKLPYRLLCTATPAPNDYIELGTSSEALGYLGYSDMLSRFFKQSDNKAFRMNEVKLAREANQNHYAKLAYRIAQTIGQYHLKAHAELPFWRWVCSWAMSCRKPSDLGFDDTRFALPPLRETHHTITPQQPAPGMLFDLPAFGLQEEREERRRTIHERCEYAASLVDHDQPALVWCQYNQEGDLLEQLIPDAVQIAGKHTDEQKETRWADFIAGKTRVIICKPKLGAWGLNLQHCAHVVTFVSHSFEQYYQSIRRCYRFGQTRPVQVDIIATRGEERVADNMQRKAQAATVMFQRLIECMHQATALDRSSTTPTPVEIPSWLTAR